LAGTELTGFAQQEVQNYRTTVGLQLDDIFASEGVGTGKKQAYPGVQCATDTVVERTQVSVAWSQLHTGE
jgi:hypothetical protein